MTLAALLDSVASGLAEVTRNDAPDGVEYRRGEVLFASAVSDSAEFRLGRAVALAARATPAVTSTSRGDDWVRFAPPELDRFARDRASAWFTHAWRSARPG